MTVHHIGVSLALLQPGDQVLIPDNAYGPGKELARGELARFGVEHIYYDPLDPQDLAARITPATRLVWLEAPGSVTMEFPDLKGLIAAARARGVTTALDNTWGAGIAFNAFDHDAIMKWAECHKVSFLVGATGLAVGEPDTTKGGAGLIDVAQHPECGAHPGMTRPLLIGVSARDRTVLRARMARQA